MFIRLAGLIEPQKGRKVSLMDVKFCCSRCSGICRITDMMLQDGTNTTAHLPNTREMLLSKRDGEAVRPPRFFNVIVRGNKMVVLPNLGDLPAGLDYTIYAYGNVPELTLAHYPYTRRTVIKEPLANGDVYRLHASTRVASKNGIPNHSFEGLFHNVAAGDARFNIDSVGEETGRPYPKLRLLLEFQEMQVNMKL